MPRFLDYNRTVIGYHGTRRSVARSVINLEGGFAKSSNPHDWLGDGVYFWEHAPKQAWRWAEHLRIRREWKEPVAVVGCMIRLGNCFDLLDPDNVNELADYHDALVERLRKAGRPVPRNFNDRKYLDREVLEFAYTSMKKTETLPTPAAACTFRRGRRWIGKTRGRGRAVGSPAPRTSNCASGTRSV